MAILLADDEPSVRALLGRILQDAGFEIIEAPDGREAWRLIQKLHPTIELVVSDVVMPHLSGTELGARIRQSYPNLQVLLVSGYSAEELKARGLGRSEFPLIKKPFHAVDFLQSVQRLVSRRS